MPGRSLRPGSDIVAHVGTACAGTSGYFFLFYPDCFAPCAGTCYRVSMTTTTVETLDSVRSRQVVWPTWMDDATTGLGDDDLVEVTTEQTPFGSYVLALRPVR